MGQKVSTYEWKENLACVATYNVLEGDKFLDQFEDASIPFSKAADVAMGTLRYYPKTTTNSAIIELLSLEIAREFLKFITKVYTVEKENTNTASTEIITSIAAVFKDSKKTVKELAEIVDKHIKFPDEV